MSLDGFLKLLGEASIPFFVALIEQLVRQDEPDEAAILHELLLPIMRSDLSVTVRMELQQQITPLAATVLIHKQFNKS